MKELQAIAKPSTFTCPECGGALWEVNQSRPVRLRCHTGHAYTLRTLEDGQLKASDEAMSAAIRALQERELLLRRMATLDRQAGDEGQAAATDVQADEVARQVLLLRRMVEAP